MGREDVELDKKDSKEEILNCVEKLATEYEQTYRGCGRCSLAALQKQFSFGNDETLKASTPLAAGVAFKGEVCGALIGGIMALGILTASQDLSDSKTMGKAMATGYKLYNRFVKEMGTANCFKIQEMKLGRHFNLADPKEYEDFQKAGGYAECSKVVGKAARLAAEMILELREKEGEKK
jgi:C_GCAxxG_C_C family probable redox protein